MGKTGFWAMLSKSLIQLSAETSGESEGQGNLACCNPWRRKELDRTEQRNNNKSPGRQMAPSIKSITHVGLIHSNQE